MRLPHSRPAALRNFVARHTRWTRPPLCPELVLGLADDPDDLWFREELALGAGHAFPYWAVAWPAGQALARTVLDLPTLVAGKTVLDLGAGSGIAAIAAMISGARRVAACDCDALAHEGIARNARRNGVAVEPVGADAMLEDGVWDVVMAADIWYDALFARQANALLARQARLGRRVLVADGSRAHFRRPLKSPLATYTLAAAARLEQRPEVTISVWEMAAGRSRDRETAH